MVGNVITTVYEQASDPVPRVISISQPLVAKPTAEHEQKHNELSAMNASVSYIN